MEEDVFSLLKKLPHSYNSCLLRLIISVLIAMHSSLYSSCSVRRMISFRSAVQSLSYNSCSVRRMISFCNAVPKSLK